MRKWASIAVSVATAVSLTSDFPKLKPTSNAPSHPANSLDWLLVNVASRSSTVVSSYNAINFYGVKSALEKTRNMCIRTLKS